MKIDVKRLEDRSIKSGERWVYSAGFNVKLDLKSTERIDSEVEDIKQISYAGGIVAILSHQGRQGDGNIIHLDFVADYLTKRLGKKVKYFPENNTIEAIDFANSLKEGEIAIVGNTRFNEGEEKNYAELAEQFSKFGDFAAIGGFNKAHREHASNIGVLNYLPGFLTRNHLREMELLKPWAGRSESYSVAILGGVKKEKIIIGLKGFSKIYDFIIPGGIVLNTILKVKGYNIGNSVIEDDGKTFEKEVKEILKENEKNIYIPSIVFVTKDFKNSNLIYICEGVGDGYSIVDFVLDNGTIKTLERTVNEKGRILLAGAPSLYKNGFKNATMQCLHYLKNPGVKSIILGGDSINEIPFNGAKSSGGGSSLEYLCSGTTAVYEALKRNKEKFS